METSNQYMVFKAGGIDYIVPVEYVGYIVTTAEQFPQCLPPKMPAYVKRIMFMEQKLVPIVDLAKFEKDKDIKDQEHFYSLILVLEYQGQSVGVLTENISLLIAPTEVEIEEDAVTQRRILNLGGESLILLNIPGFFNEIKKGKTHIE